jgi:hypothetical protein
VGGGEEEDTVSGAGVVVYPMKNEIAPLPHTTHKINSRLLNFRKNDIILQECCRQPLIKDLNEKYIFLM